MDIVRECRERYDGRVRNPFNEIECGHWYARAMASYGMLQGLQEYGMMLLTKPCTSILRLVISKVSSVLIPVSEPLNGKQESLC